jgi:hypothetical protein
MSNKYYRVCSLPAVILQWQLPITLARSLHH